MQNHSTISQILTRVNKRVTFNMDLKLLLFLVSIYILDIQGLDNICGDTHNKPKVIDLQGRYLKTLSLNASDWDVHKLILDNNWIQDIGNLDILTNLTNLTHLSLRGNRIASLHINSFPSLPCLTYLDIKGNPFTITDLTVPKGAFKPIPNLLILKIPDGPVPISALTDLPKLEELHMGLLVNENYSLPIQLATGFSSLKVLNFAHGRFPAISEHLIKNLRDSTVEEISFRQCRISRIEKGVFSDFPSLKTLNLACNEMDDGFNYILDALSVSGTTQLDTLIMDAVNKGNAKIVILTPEKVCTNMTKTLQRLSTRSNMIIGMHVDIVKCIQNLEVISLGYFNYPEVMVPYINEGHKFDELVANLPFRVADASYIFGVGSGFDNAFCDSDLSSDEFFPRPLSTYPLVEVPPKEVPVTGDDFEVIPLHMEHLKADHMGLHETSQRYIFHPFHPNNSLKVLEMSHNQLLTKFPQLGNAFYLQILDISYNSLEAISDRAMALLETSELRYLNLSHNHLYISNPDFRNSFHYLHHLIHLDLSHNGLTNIHSQAFKKNTKLEILLLTDNDLDESFYLEFQQDTSIHLLDISSNAIQYLSKLFLAQLDKLNSTVQLNISGNPFQCGCDSIDFIRWFQTTNINIISNEELTCPYNNGSSALLNVNVEELNDICFGHKTRTIKTIIISSIAPVTILLTLIVIAYRWRWHLRWYYYTMKRRHRENDLLFDTDVEVPFNAYVIFNEEDDLSFVYQTIRNKFEKDGNCRLFLNGRDDMPGNTKADNVIEGMNRCAHVIAVITPSFLQDEMCEFAIHMTIVKGINSLIVLMMDKPDLSKVSSTLRGVLSPSAKVPIYDWPEEDSGQALIMQKLLDRIGTTMSNMTII